MSIDFDVLEQRVAEARVVHRKELLAKMAATIAAGDEANVECNRWTPDETAKRAVEVAEAILAKVGL